MTNLCTAPFLLVPVRPSVRPKSGDDHSCGARPGRPPLTWTTTTTESEDTPHTNPSSSQTSGTNRALPGPRSIPAWTAALHLLDDMRWHPTTDLIQTMLTASDLAPRTVQNQIGSARRQRWISRRRGKIRLREPRLIEAAIKAVEARR